MMNYQKYSKGYFMPPEMDLEWAKKDAPDKAPVWCSVDMRDGNQALIIPMNLDEKLEFYKMLLKVGFKEIEVGFPAASETEYEFLRRLVEDDLIPDDVTIQVLTQAREHIIRKTFEALKGVKNAVVHVYNSTSVAQREQVFRKSKEEIKEIAVEGAKLLKKLTEEAGEDYRFEYSTGICAGSLQCGARCMAAHGRPKGHHQPACNRGNVHAACLRYAGCLYEQAFEVPRKCGAVPASA